MMNKITTVRFAKEEELEQTNALRKQVYDLHAQGKPLVFNPVFSEELRDYIYSICNDPQKDIVVNEREGLIVGYAVLHHIHLPKSPFMIEREYLDIEEFCVDASWHRKGIAAEMINHIRSYALAFYESIGFKTFRRYMEMTC